VGQLPDTGVGGEGLEPVAVDVAEGQLRTGVRPFTADNDPDALGPAGGREAGQLGHVGTVADVSVGVDRRLARGHPQSGRARIAACTRSVMVNPTENCTSSPWVSRSDRTWVSHCLEQPAPSAHVSAHPDQIVTATPGLARLTKHPGIQVPVIARPDRMRWTCALATVGSDRDPVRLPRGGFHGGGAAH
jgi:hypothetical protein